MGKWKQQKEKHIIMLTRKAFETKVFCRYFQTQKRPSLSFFFYLKGSVVENLRYPIYEDNSYLLFHSALWFYTVGTLLE